MRSGSNENVTGLEQKSRARAHTERRTSRDAIAKGLDEDLASLVSHYASCGKRMRVTEHCTRRMVLSDRTTPGGEIFRQVVRNNGVGFSAVQLLSERLRRVTAVRWALSEGSSRRTSVPRWWTDWLLVAEPPP